MPRPAGVCPHCGEPFERMANAVYCSRVCSQAAWYERAKQQPGFIQARIERTTRWDQSHNRER